MNLDTINIENHPCFNPKACNKVGRVHLPVAPRCNVQCNFCNRKFDCVNESRPGVTSKVLSPGQAMAYLDKVFDARDDITVIGIAGPGDPFANPDETMESLRRARAKYPKALLCVATNGLGIEPYIEELAQLKVTHITLTINAVDPEIAAKIYAWGRHNKRVHRGEQLGKLIVDKQLHALRSIKASGIIAKVNTIIIPGINDEHIPEIARAVSEIGADVMNCIPLIPTADTVFEDLPAPEPKMVARLRFQCGDHVPQMLHCARCRADACGIVGKDDPKTTEMLLEEAASLPREPDQRRPYVAVASLEGALVNQHLGESARFLVFSKDETTASGYKYLEVRKAPKPGGGIDRWTALAEMLGDCRALLVSAAGPKPKGTLEQSGISVVEMEGLIEEGLRCVYEGRPVPRNLSRQFDGCSKGVACAGTGTGCG